MQIILDLVLPLLKQFMVFLPFDVQLLDVLCVFGNGFSEVFDLIFEMEGVLISISGVFKVNDVVLGLDQLLFILFVGLGQD